MRATGYKGLGYLGFNHFTLKLKNKMSVKGQSGTSVSSKSTEDLKELYSKSCSSSIYSSNASSEADAIFQSKQNLIYGSITKEAVAGVMQHAEKLTAKGENSTIALAEKTDNNKKLVEEITGFVNNYNNMLAGVNKVGTASDKTYAMQIANYAEKAKESLKNVGITVLNGGKLTVNQKVLAGSSVEALKEAFAGKNEFAYNVNNKAKNIKLSSSSAANKKYIDFLA